MLRRDRAVGGVRKVSAHSDGSVGAHPVDLAGDVLRQNARGLHARAQDALWRGPCATTRATGRTSD